MTGIPKLFIVEYSLTQNATTARTLQAMMVNNREQLMKGNLHDRVPIGIFHTRAEADQFIFSVGPTLTEQAQFEFHSRDWQHISEVLYALLPKDLNPKDSDE
jgi:hypothetical protein